jgi:hypothetical protein
MVGRGDGQRRCDRIKNPGSSKRRVVKTAYNVRNISANRIKDQVEAGNVNTCKICPTNKKQL